MTRKVLLTVSLSLVLVLLFVGTVAAQGTQPPVKPDPTAKALKGWGWFYWPGPFGDWTVFDAIAKTLKLTPTQLFEQLHSGKTLQEIATAQNVEMTAIQQAIKDARLAQARDAIQKALESGKITKERAEWLLKGLENGWTKPFFGGRRGWK